jgi:hypothetical protein
LPKVESPFVREVDAERAVKVASGPTVTPSVELSPKTGILANAAAVIAKRIVRFIVFFLFF